jgi:hypothetical protein
MLSRWLGDDKELELRAAHVYEDWSFSVPGRTVFHLPTGLFFKIDDKPRKKSKRLCISHITARLAERCDGTAMDIEIIRQIGEGAIYTYFDVGSFSPPLRQPIPNDLGNEIPF